VLTAIRDAGVKGIDFAELKTAAPQLEGQTEDQLRMRLSSALSRARIKGHAKALEDGKTWVMA